MDLQRQDEVKQTLYDLVSADCDMNNFGSNTYSLATHHLPVTKNFIGKVKEYEEFALGLGFKSVASGPLVGPYQMNNPKSQYFITLSNLRNDFTSVKDRRNF